MLFIVVFLVALSCLIIFRPMYKKNEPFYPPGPRGLPFIGNLHQYDFSTPHEYLANLAKIYGPILSLRLGRVHVVVVQSSKLAKEVLKTQDLNFAGRPLLIGAQKLSYGGLDIAFSPYNDCFRDLKKISIVHLLNSKRVQSFASTTTVEISRMIQKISALSSSSTPVNLKEMLTSYASSNICKIAFGKSYDDDEGLRSRFRSLLDEAEELFVSFTFTDCLPSIGWLDKLTGKSLRLEKTFRDLDAFYEKIINDHLHPNNHKPLQEDLIDVLLHLHKESSFSFDLTLNHVKAILMNVFVAGTDSSSVMAIWGMTELIKNPGAMKKVQEELRNGLKNRDGFISESDLQRLDYFKAVVKETFRLHPAAPLLVAHEATNNTILEGFDIVRGAVVFVNAWAIGRDPVSWKDPEKFKPERFLGSSIDFRGHDFELIPFGAGRRMCPAIHLGVVNMELALASLLHSFDWELPGGVMEKDVDTITQPGIAMHKKNPLFLVAKKNLQV